MTGPGRVPAYAVDQADAERIQTEIRAMVAGWRQHLDADYWARLRPLLQLTPQQWEDHIARRKAAA